MNSIGNKISDIRKSKGLTQEQLAERSNINLRTIQRIENGKNEPRGTTLDLICDALEVNSELLIDKAEKSKRKSFGSFIINGIFLTLLNILLICIIGFLTLDSNANLNSFIGAFLLSFFISFFIVLVTEKMGALERMFKFGTGFFVYIVMVLIAQGFTEGIRVGLRTGLFLCLIISIGMLYYGKTFLKFIK
jgi:transcriptional regulator with XRE-family HTH domain